MTSKGIHPLQAFSSAIGQTFVQHFTRFNWQHAHAVPQQQLGFLSHFRPWTWLQHVIFWQRFGLLSKFFDLLWYMWITTTKIISGKLLGPKFVATMQLLSNYFDLLLVCAWACFCVLVQTTASEGKKLAANSSPVNSDQASSVGDSE